MLQFKKPEIEDKSWVDKCLSYAQSMNCEYTFGNIYVWSTAYSTTICKYNDFLMCRWGKGKDLQYSVPIGKGDFRDAVNRLIYDSKELGIKLRIYGVTANYKKLLDKYFPNQFSYIENDGFDDYIYSVEKNITEKEII